MSGVSNDTKLAGWRRTHTLGELSEKDEGQKTTLMGWVHRRRDHGKLIFLDLRDRYGMTQVVLDPAHSPDAHSRGEELRGEYVVAVHGSVRKRPEGMINRHIPTGAIEVEVDELKVLNRSAVLPFPVHQEEHLEATETLRLKHRYIDLRRPSMRDKIVGRARLTRAIRNAMEAEDFLDLETPYLAKSTPEGAREFLVPSRLHPGHFYALPQSPQLFKQVLMMSGFDRYYQVVRCFRDEDLRADRQPEFTQVDCEMSFVEQEEVLETFERIVKNAVTEFKGEEFKGAFQRIPYDEAMESYGVDKPDLRFDLKLVNVTEAVKDTEFKVFREAASTGGIVNALVLPEGAESFSRKDMAGLEEIAKKQGAKGLAWAKIKTEGGEPQWQSPIAKFFDTATIKRVHELTGAGPGDLILFGAGDYETVKASLGALRTHLGETLKLYDPETLCFAWVVDFPLLEFDPDSGKWMARHHPFTMPRPEDMPLLDDRPEDVRAAAYDLVLNGHEVAGGSIRIHDPEVQSQIFTRLGLSKEEAEFKFGFLLEALRYGAPPHGGMAFGLDRLAMILQGADAIRDVIPFPKTQRGMCLMSESPAEVAPEDLRDLHIRVQKPLNE